MNDTVGSVSSHINRCTRFTKVPVPLETSLVAVEIKDHPKSDKAVYGRKKGIGYFNGEL